MKYLHTMVRVTDLDASLDFYCNALGLQEVGRHDSEQGATIASKDASRLFFSPHPVMKRHRWSSRITGTLRSTARDVTSDTSRTGLMTSTRFAKSFWMQE
jgi:catechol 2,3-dioxygenase-like lactoylglutathione lyase family enzyme